MEHLFFLGPWKNIIVLVHDIFVNSAHAAITLPTLDDSQDLSELIISIYNYAIAIVGFAVFIQFIHAGLLYLFAAGNAANTHHAREIMQNAVLGAILLLSSYLILDVINPDLKQTNIFNMQVISDLMPKGLERYDPKCDIDPASCREATNASEQQLKDLGVDWGGTNVDGMSRNSFRLLGNIRANCGCNVTLAGYEKTPGGEIYSLSPPQEIYDYLKDKANVTASENTTVGGDAVIKKTWIDGSGNIYTTYEKDGYLSNTAAAIVVKVPAR